MTKNNLQYHSKNELARGLVYLVTNYRLPFAYLTFDSWYASKQNLRFFSALGITFVTALHSNRKVHYKYLLTNEVGSSVCEVIQRYRTRWAIECTFREMKQHLGLLACQARTPQKLIGYLAVVMLAFVCMETIRCWMNLSQDETKIQDWTIGETKRTLQSQTIAFINNLDESYMIPVAFHPLEEDLFKNLISISDSLWETNTYLP